MKTNNNVKLAAQKCWGLVAYKLLRPIVQGKPINVQDVSNTLDAEPIVQKVLTQSAAEKGQVSQEVWEFLTKWKTGTDELFSLIPTGEREVSDVVTEAKISLSDELQILDLLLDGDFDKFKELKAQSLGVKSSELDIPFERTLQKIFKIRGKYLTDKAKLAQFVERVRKLINDDNFKPSQDRVKAFFLEQRYLITGFYSELNPPECSLELLDMINEEVKTDRELAKYHTMFEEDLNSTLCFLLQGIKIS
ncbi:MAG: hypothetical protein HY094_06690 [Candidatus Melainabacteria bacterium]|nr:hypothetical protein [Candidatus Melainabacteria bacterium]